MTEAHFSFHGKVQGVNFRSTAKKLAVTLQIHGSVKNESNGSVYLIAQGSKENIFKLVQTLKKQFSIEKIEEKQVSAATTYSEFTILR